MRETPSSGDRLKGDFVGTLRDEGLEIDEEFLWETKNRRRAQVQDDIRRKMLRRPPSEKRYIRERGTDRRTSLKCVNIENSSLV